MWGGISGQEKEKKSKQANPKYNTIDKPGLSTSMRRDLHSW